MVVDTSALVAVLRNEPDGTALMDRLAQHPAPVISAVTWMETRMVLLSRSGESGVSALRDLIVTAGIQVVPVSSEQADLAFGAFRHFGKGRRSAGLNFGDCFAYALAKELNAPLLFKGDDFAKTDLVAALPPA